MKNFLFLLFLTVLGSIEGSSQELPKTTSQLSIVQTINNLGFMEQDNNHTHTLMVGYDYPNKITLPLLDGNNIAESFYHPLDTDSFPSLVQYASVSTDMGSIAGKINASENHDNQVRASVIRLSDGSVVRQVTLRNMKIGARVRDQKVVNDKYLYILISDSKPHSTIEDGYSGFPYDSSNGVALNHDGPILIQVRIADFNIRTYKFPEGASFKRGTLDADSQGNVYLQASRDSDYSNFYLLGINEEMDVLFSTESIKKVGFSYDYRAPVLHAALSHEYLVYWNGSFPGIYNITTGENIVSSDLKNGLDWADRLNGDSNIQAIHHIPGTEKFLFIRTDSAEEWGRAWLQVVDVHGERSLYFRERIEITKDGASNIMRPHIISSYFDDQKKLHYLGLYHRYEKGTVLTFNGQIITDGTELEDNNIIYKGILEGIDVNFPPKGGLIAFTPEGGSATYDYSDGNNNVIYSGVSDTGNITVQRELKDGYTAVPEDYVDDGTFNLEFSPDFSSGKIQRTIITNSTFFSKIDVMMIVREYAPARLSVESFSEEGLSIFPNPASDTVTIRFTDSQVVDLSIYNLMGQMILRKTQVYSGESVDVSSLARGMYIMHFSINEKRMSKKLVLF